MNHINSLISSLINSFNKSIAECSNTHRSQIYDLLYIDIVPSKIFGIRLSNKYNYIHNTDLPFENKLFGLYAK